MIEFFLKKYIWSIKRKKYVNMLTCSGFEKNYYKHIYALGISNWNALPLHMYLLSVHFDTDEPN